MTIEELDLSVRSYNCLKRAGIDTVEQLKAMTGDELSRIRNISQMCVDEIRQKVRAKVITNADRIRAMTDEQLADFLTELSYSEENPWSEPFTKAFCCSCPAPEYTLDDGQKINLHECDFSDGKCPHGKEAVWWIKQQAY